MSKIIKKIYRSIQICGLDFRTILFSIRGLPQFIIDLYKYSRASAVGGLPIKLSNLFVVLADRYDSAGVAKGHYFFQDLWAARKIYLVKPSKHVDIGSSVMGFVSHLLVFMDKVEVIDIRSLESKVSGQCLYKIMQHC